jgi:phosphoribosyl-AMP cyclohydrolase
MSSQRDETTSLDLAFDANGLIPAIVIDSKDGAVLMFAFMNREAFDMTRETGHLHFYSRSRKRLWKKGETSGETFAVVEILTDCDQDVLQVRVKPEGQGFACHTGRRSCFYRRIADGELEFIETA